MFLLKENLYKNKIYNFIDFNRIEEMSDLGRKIQHFR